MDTKHKTLADVRQTIRGEIASEQLFIAQANKMTKSVTTQMAIDKATAHINAYKVVLMWLSDLEM